MDQRSTIENFCKDAEEISIKIPLKEMKKIDFFTFKEVDLDLKNHEVFRSLGCKNGDYLFCFDINEESFDKFQNPLLKLKESIEDAKKIEMVYPNMFSWRFSGVNLHAMAIIPSGDEKVQGTIGRYGGVINFYKILRNNLQRIANIGKNRALNRDFNPKRNGGFIRSTGSINNFTGLYCIPVKLTWKYLDILKLSKSRFIYERELPVIDFKFWSKEINPDMLLDKKHPPLKEPIKIDVAGDTYPPCIKRLMTLRKKGNYARYLLSRYFLSLHKPREAKFLLDSILSEEEKEHIRTGNCSNQWRYILNNIDRYGPPSCVQLSKFCYKTCKRTHPMEIEVKKE